MHVDGAPCDDDKRAGEADGGGQAGEVLVEGQAPPPPAQGDRKESCDGKEEKDGPSSRSHSRSRSKLVDRSVFLRPLLYYRRHTPLMRRDQAAPPPTEIIFPDNTIALAFSADSLERDDAAGPQAAVDDNLVVFTSPGHEAAMRRKWYACIIYVLLAALLVLVSVAYAFDAPHSAGRKTIFAGSLLTMAFGVAAIVWKNSRMCTIFVAVTCIDALLTLLRLTSVVDFVQAVLQGLLCHFMKSFKGTLLPNWFVPVNH